MDNGSKNTIAQNEPGPIPADLVCKTHNQKWGFIAPKKYMWPYVMEKYVFKNHEHPECDTLGKNTIEKYDLENC